MERRDEIIDKIVYSMHVYLTKLYMFLTFPIQNVIYSYYYSRHLSVFDPTLLLIFLRSAASALVVLEDSKSTALWNKYVIFPEIILYLSLFLMTNT